MNELLTHKFLPENSSKRRTSRRRFWFLVPCFRFIFLTRNQRLETKTNYLKTHMKVEKSPTNHFPNPMNAPAIHPSKRVPGKSFALATPDLDQAVLVKSYR